MKFKMKFGEKYTGSMIFFRIMRAIVLFFFLGITASFASNTYSQETFLSINVNNKTVKEVFKHIESHSEFIIFCMDDVVDLDRKVSLNLKDQNVETILNSVFKNTGNVFKIKDRQIIITKRANILQPSAVQQKGKIKVTGKVTDQQGEPVIGGSVVEKGTTNGTMTDMDGLFTFEVEEAAVVQVSYIGYQTKEVSVAGKKNIQVQLVEDMQALDEVVVVGFGTQKKVNLTGSVSMVNSEVLENRPVQNVGQALQGVVPGLNFSVNKTGGELNNSLDVDIRGAGTIGEGSKSAPLVLIDGIEGDMNSINPNDIKSISVLKDAASSAIYGSRAAFGVILITTKEGHAGRTSVNYSNNVRFTTPLALPTMMDSYQFAQFFNRAAANQGDSPAFDETTIKRIIDYQAGKITSGSQVRPDGHFSENVLANGNVDWFKETYRRAVPSHEHNLSVSGGNEKITYLVSSSFMNQNGLIAYNSDDFKRYTLNARLKAELSEYVTLTYGSKWIREDYLKPSYFGELFYDTIARTWPTCPVRDDNGNYLGSIINRLVYGGDANEQKDQTYNQLQLIVEPIKNWKIYAEGNMRTINRMNHSEGLLIPWWFASGEASWSTVGAQTTTVAEESYRDNYLTGNIYTDYFKQFDSGHYFKAMVGFNAELMKSRGLKGSMDNLISIDLPTLNTATENPLTSGGYTHWSTVGFFGRLNYNYKERYMLEVNMRYDGTSRFLGDKQWGIFPSFSAGWNMAREDFFQNMENVKDYISMLKLRVSWGQLGNTNTENLYPFYLTMPVGNANGSWLVDGQKQNTSYAPGIVSSLMTWETVESWNVGLDWGTLDNRLTGSFDYFVRNTLDMIGPAPELPSILGTKVPKINNADMKSYGFELELGWRDQVGDFTYGAKVVLSDNKRKVTHYPNEKGDYAQWYTGKMSGEYWGYETIGIAKTQEEMNQHLASLPNGGQDALGTKWSAGDIMYKDLDGDGKIDAGSSTLGDSGDKKIIGNSTPRYRYGVTLDGSWKGFDLNLFFQGVAKRDYILEGPYFWGAKNGQWHSLGFEEHWDFFRPEGDPLGANLNSYYPRPLFSQGGKNQQNQTRYLQNAAYIRLKNVQLGYTFPRTWVNKIGLQSLRLYFSGDNLLTFTKLHGYFDPETLGDTGDNTGKVYPLSKTLSVGLNINF